VRNKYQLDAVIGEGGMAVVYAATHRNKKRFAVKMLRSDLASADTIRRFLREGYVANTVDHEDAVAVIDDDVADDGSAFLVMELLEGESVEQLAALNGGRLEPRVVLAIAHQLLDVLAAAHAKGVVHRDIKPGNLFLTHAGRIKVLDFGIARLREAHEGARATHTGAMMGTPSFMAPEQARGKSSQVSELTDVWAVGATMFALLSGHFVHEGESPQELVVASATTPPRSLATVSDAPDALVTFVDRALAFEPLARWPGAAAMRDEAAALHVALFGERVPRAIAVGRAPVAVRASDPMLRAHDTHAAVAPTMALAPKTEQLAPIAEALTSPLATTGEPVALGGAPARQTTRTARRSPVVVGAIVTITCVAGAAVFVFARSRAPHDATAEKVAADTSTVATTTATPSAAASAIAIATATASASGSAPATPERTTPSASASAASHAPTASVAAKRPPAPAVPRASAAVKASDWDRQ
jgi:serine/threonine-protein kinase